MENIGNINTIYSLIAFVIFYVGGELIKWQTRKKNNKVKEEKATQKIVEKLESKFNLLEKMLKEHVDSDKIQIKGLVIQNFIHHNPKRKIVIEKLYKEYKDLGGNGYIDELFETWNEKQNNNN